MINPLPIQLEAVVYAPLMFTAPGKLIWIEPPAGMAEVELENENCPR